MERVTPPVLSFIHNRQIAVNGYYGYETNQEPPAREGSIMDEDGNGRSG
jgi:hypothetical protein